MADYRSILASSRRTLESAVMSQKAIATEKLRRIISELLPELTEFRHDLHAHPELMYQERRTAQRVREELDKAGIAHADGLAGGTGTLGFLPGAGGGAAIALRADMDALPIKEETGLPYASRTPGVMHACGHDGHTTICLGAAKALKRLAEETGGVLPRPVKFVFQPAEEGGAGGRRMVEDGCLTEKVLGPKVSEMYGLHCWPTLPVGVLSSKVGALLAATDEFNITIRGRGGHAAFPHVTADPVVAAAELTLAMQTIVSRNMDPLDSMVVSVTVIQAGTAHNVIPESAVLRGTMRTLNDTSRALGRKRIYELAEHIAAAHRAKAEIEWREGYPVTRNDAKAVATFFKHAKAAVGEERAVECMAPVMGGEDFAYYCSEVPACFFLLGQQVRAGEAYPLVHTPKFNFNDESIALGVEMFCRIALGEENVGG